MWSNSDVVVQLELVRVGTQPHRVHLIDARVGDPGVENVRGDYAALDQVLEVRFEHL